MKRNDFISTIEHINDGAAFDMRTAVLLLVAISHLLYAIAENMDVFEDEEDPE